MPKATLDNYEFKLSSQTVRGHREVAYHTRIKVPFTYGDGLWRICIYAWLDNDGRHDGRGWYATINGRKVKKDGYKTPRSAAIAVRRAIGMTHRSVQKLVSANNLVREK